MTTTGTTTPASAVTAPKEPVASRLAGGTGFASLALAAGWGALLCYAAMTLVPASETAPAREPEQEYATGFGPALREIPADIMRVRAARRMARAPEPEALPEELADEAGQSPQPLVAATAAPHGPVAVASAEAFQPVAGTGLPEPVAAPAKPKDDFVGTWGPTPAACGERARRNGYLPAVITLNGAKAGGTNCTFRDTARDGASWVMAASCGDKARRWSSQVRLQVNGDRLTWSSGKGTSSYVRCGRREG